MTTTWFVWPEPVNGYPVQINYERHGDGWESYCAHPLSDVPVGAWDTLHGMMAQGDTAQEAIDNLCDVWAAFVDGLEPHYIHPPAEMPAITMRDCRATTTT